MLATASLRLSRVLPSSATTRSKVWVAAGVGCSRRRSAMMPYRLTPRFITEPGRAVQVSIARPHTLNEMGVDTKSKAVVKKPAAQPRPGLLHLRDPVRQLRRDRGRDPVHGQQLAPRARPGPPRPREDHRLIRAGGTRQV